ncbi:hypothetical protein Droror1_Dr00010308 [Drosera rotundifolia]
MGLICIVEKLARGFLHIIVLEFSAYATAFERGCNSMNVQLPRSDPPKLKPHPLHTPPLPLPSPPPSPTTPPSGVFRRKHLKMITPPVSFSSSFSGLTTTSFLPLFSSPILPPPFHHPRIRALSSCSPVRCRSNAEIRKTMITRALLSVQCNDSTGQETLTIEKGACNAEISLKWMSSSSLGAMMWLAVAHEAHAIDDMKLNEVYEVGGTFELGIQLSYLLLLLALLGAGTFFVIRQVLVRRELDLSAKELQEQVRSGDANATGYFELGAVMLRRKIYPVATKYLLQAIEKWDGEDQDLAQVYNALGVSYVRDGKVDKGIAQFQNAVRLQPGYVTAWNNLGDAYEKKKELNLALKAFEEVLLFDPNNKLARPRAETLRQQVKMYKGVTIKSSKDK